MKRILLNRNDFRNGVFERDNNKCVICSQKAIFDDNGNITNLDAHHIMERRLFTGLNFGGYFLDNGSSLCTKHHIEAEMTTLSCEDIREACGIEEIVLPDHLYSEQRYDKWGNQILKNGTRLKGELFEDGSVQKILKAGNVLGEFVDIVKYPRTFHLPWSPGVTRDDRIMPDYTIFDGQQVMICEKRDGENCLSEENIITTEDGPKTIKYICETKYKGKVLTYNIETGEKEFQKIYNWRILENNNDWCEIILENDDRLILTSDHYIWLPELNCYRMVKDLKINDDVLLNRHKNFN